MSLRQQLMEKPWLSDGGLTKRAGVIGLEDGRSFYLPTAKVGLRVFLVVATVLFSLFIAVYSARSMFSDWHSTPIPWLLWPNTAILILSSGFLQWARVSARRGRIDGVKVGLFVGGVLTFAFLAGQLLAWRELAAAGHYMSAGPANAFFYLLTAVHGIHLFGGLVAWGKTINKIRQGRDLAEVNLSIELCTIYWHFLLMIWLVLLTLLLAT